MCLFYNFIIYWKIKLPSLGIVIAGSSLKILFAPCGYEKFAFSTCDSFFFFCFISQNKKKRHKEYLAYLDRKYEIAPYLLCLFCYFPFLFCLLSSHLPGGDGGDCVNTEYYLKKLCGSSAAVWDYYCTLNVTRSLIQNILFEFLFGT